MLRATIWFSVIAWAASEVLRRAGADRRAAARALYAATARRTLDMTGLASGAGLYLNYLFVAVWIADAARLCLPPARGAAAVAAAIAARAGLARPRLEGHRA